MGDKDRQSFPAIPVRRETRGDFGGRLFSEQRGDYDGTQGFSGIAAPSGSQANLREEGRDYDGRPGLAISRGAPGPSTTMVPNYKKGDQRRLCRAPGTTIWFPSYNKTDKR